MPPDMFQEKPTVLFGLQVSR